MMHHYEVRMSKISDKFKKSVVIERLKGKRPDEELFKYVSGFKGFHKILEQFSDKAGVAKSLGGADTLIDGYLRNFSGVQGRMIRNTPKDKDLICKDVLLLIDRYSTQSGDLNFPNSEILELEATGKRLSHKMSPLEI
jgi:hypothetical protein